MKIGSLKEERLTYASAIFLFDCRVLGLDVPTRNVYRTVLASFIRFTGDVLVKDLTHDHVQMYVANLSDGPGEGEEHRRIAMSQYALIHAWVCWLEAQRSITERDMDLISPPPLTDLFPLLVPITRLAYCC